MALKAPNAKLDDLATVTPNAGERIAKRIARAGLCSRRQAEQWILAGRVAIDGGAIDRAAINVEPTQVITVDGRPLPAAEPARLWRYHKPRGLLTTARDPQGRATIFERMPTDLPRVVSVGRLDMNSEGLLLLTNDGELARKLEHPKTGWVRRYRVRAHGQVSPQALDDLKHGLTVDGIRYGPIGARLDREGRNNWLTVNLREGKNREIRRVFESMELAVNRLIRVAFGPFELASLAANDVREVPATVLDKVLSKAFGKQLREQRKRDADHRR